MPQILELAHLVQQHGMAQMQIGRGRIEARLHAQRPAKFQSRLQFFEFDDFLGAARDLFQCCRNVVHGGS